VSAEFYIAIGLCLAQSMHVVQLIGRFTFVECNHDCGNSNTWLLILHCAYFMFGTKHACCAAHWEVYICWM